MGQFVSLLGIPLLMGVAVLFSSNRKAIDWKLVSIGVTLQGVFALIILKTEAGRWFFDWVNDIVIALLGFTEKGSRFLFGDVLMDPSKLGFVFVIQVLPTIVFFSAFMSLLYYLGVMQIIVKVMAKFMVKLLGTSGAETLSATANIFVGQTEAPLLLRPYIKHMTRSELMVVMTGGFATVAGGVMAAYVAMLKDFFPDIAGHLMAASVMSAPAALVMAKILVPETEEPATKGTVNISSETNDSNMIEAAANGASVGVQLAINVGAMLLAFIALIALGDSLLQFVSGLFGLNLSLSTLFSWIFYPLAFIMGVDSQDCLTVGQLLGEKLVINEFVAYASFQQMLQDGVLKSDRSIVIITYALCGFANFSSIGIQIGGIGGLAPEKKSELAKLGLVALLGGTLACCQTATIAGALVSEGTLDVNKAPITQPLEKESAQVEKAESNQKESEETSATTE